MKFLLTILFFFLFATMLMAQHQFEWLAGRWKLAGKNVYEVWMLSDDKISLHGKSFKVVSNDTTDLEKISLRKIGDHYYYIPDVPENSAPVNFKIVMHDDRSFIAENPEHDFPKVISYTIVRKANIDLLEAKIEGNGKVILYSFEKVK